MSWDKVDWSQAPEDAVAWWVDTASDKATHAKWVVVWLNFGWNFALRGAPMFGYTGHPRDSLTLRPTGPAK